MTRRLIRSTLLFTLLAAALLPGCSESRAPFAGNYQSVQAIPGKGHYELELEMDGTGEMRITGNKLKFSWTVKDGRIWLYTKEGAVFIVTPAGDTLFADMTGNWHASCPPDQCLAFKRLPAQ